MYVHINLSGILIQGLFTKTQGNNKFEEDVNIAIGAKVDNSCSQRSSSLHVRYLLTQSYNMECCKLIDVLVLRQRQIFYSLVI